MYSQASGILSACCTSLKNSKTPCFLKTCSSQLPCPWIPVDLHDCRLHAFITLRLVLSGSFLLDKFNQLFSIHPLHLVSNHKVQCDNFFPYLNTTICRSKRAYTNTRLFPAKKYNISKTPLQLFLKLNSYGVVCTNLKPELVLLLLLRT